MPNKINRSDKNKDGIYENLVKFLKNNENKNLAKLFGNARAVSYNKDQKLPIITNNLIDLSEITGSSKK